MIDMNDENQWVKLYTRLIDMTQSEELMWSDHSHRVQRMDAVSIPYVTNYKDWILLLYSYKYKHYWREDDFDWTNGVSMELISEDGTRLWSFPKLPALGRLIDVVETKHSRIDQLFRDLLSKEKPKLLQPNPA